MTQRRTRNKLIGVLACLFVSVVASQCPPPKIEDGKIFRAKDSQAIHDFSVFMPVVMGVILLTLAIMKEDETRKGEKRASKERNTESEEAS